MSRIKLEPDLFAKQKERVNNRPTRKIVRNSKHSISGLELSKRDKGGKRTRGERSKRNKRQNLEKILNLKDSNSYKLAKVKNKSKLRSTSEIILPMCNNKEKVKKMENCIKLKQKNINKLKSDILCLEINSENKKIHDSTVKEKPYLLDEKNNQFFQEKKLKNSNFSKNEIKSLIKENEELKAEFFLLEKDLQLLSEKANLRMVHQQLDNQKLIEAKKLKELFKVILKNLIFRLLYLWLGKKDCLNFIMKKTGLLAR